jgi:vancomycin aglycone glucosyltransferase
MIDATVATQFATIGAAADGCDVIVAASALQIAARSIAEKNGVPYVFTAYSPVVLPSPHHAPAPLPPVPDRPVLPPTDDNGEL